MSALRTLLVTSLEIKKKNCLIFRKHPAHGPVEYQPHSSQRLLPPGNVLHDLSLTQRRQKRKHQNFLNIHHVLISGQIIQRRLLPWFSPTIVQEI